MPRKARGFAKSQKNDICNFLMDRGLNATYNKGMKIRITLEVEVPQSELRYHEMVYDDLMAEIVADAVENIHDQGPYKVTDHRWEEIK